MRIPREDVGGQVQRAVRPSCTSWSFPPPQLLPGQHSYLTTWRFSQPLHRMARGHVNHAPNPSRDLSDPPPARARQSEQSRSIIPSKPTHSTQARHPTSEQAWSGDRDSGPHTHSSRPSRDQNCVRLCCQFSAAPCACALPSSTFYSHDEIYVRFALSKSQRQVIVACAANRQVFVLWPPRRPQWPSKRQIITVQH